MTRDEYTEKLRQMTARELDVEVAEKVMGWKWVAFHPAHVTDELVRRPYSPTAPEYDWQYSPCEMSIPLAQGWDWDMPRYSEDIGAAWEVFVRFAYPSIWRDGEYWVGKVRVGVDDEPVFGYAATAPRAICIAACLAVWQDDACPACG